ncbi:MAG TPA: hypothetical protein VFV42_08970 [Acidimicrobiales bacterium]|nr:hypothetical protein [Acidimicrobiales bacterium]
MTDPSDAHRDSDADAEVASALHDGEAAEHERAGADDPGVAAARRRLAAVSARVADVPDAPAGLVDDHVAAALAVFDDGAGSSASGGTVVPLARRRWFERLPLGAVAAAAAVVVLVGVLGLAQAGDDDADDDTATAALESDDAVEDAETFGTDAGGADEGMAGDAAGGSTALAAGEREAYGSYDELAAALAERVPDADGSEAVGEDTAIAAPTAEGGAAEETERSSAAGCDAVRAAGLDPARVQLVVPVLVEDRLVTAVVHTDGDERRLSVVDDETCTVVERRAL